MLVHDELRTSYQCSKRFPKYLPISLSIAYPKLTHIYPSLSLAWEKWNIIIRTTIPEDKYSRKIKQLMYNYLLGGNTLHIYNAKSQFWKKDSKLCKIWIQRWNHEMLIIYTCWHICTFYANKCMLRNGDLHCRVFFCEFEKYFRRNFYKTPPDILREIRKTIMR